MNGISRHEHDEEEFVAKLLAPLDKDAAPPRSAAIDRAARLAGEAFAMANSQPVVPAPKQGTRRVITKAILALSAVALSVMVLLVNMERPVPGSATLGSILAQSAVAETLQLRVLEGSTRADIWVRAAGQVRWEESPTHYQIASGPRRWRIDEEANTVAEEANPWYRDEKKPVDLLALLGIDAELASAFQQATPERVEMIGRNRRQIFCVGDAGSAERPTIHAYSDPATGQLQQLEAWIDGRFKGRSDAKMWFVARDIDVDETQFVVSKSLSEDGRIGKVAHVQGIVTLRPLTSSRWTPVCGQMLIKPSDWLRTDVRGANAAAVATTSRFGLIAGPGSLVELVRPSQARLHRGELNVTGAKSATDTFELLGPGDQSVTIKPGASAHYRVDRAGQLVAVAKKPLWLAGFEGSSNNESIGSLICNVDGRSTPLTVGFHKVNVEIRDQIARTTIEESFVNHTARQLEGVFHFPLPQDASISGFGMWINGELVEADVVEKQRAREIYETILRERRDPGLLEWTGGNIFKARVFPILPQAEKRIKIVYTQVLPLRANRYRYSYGLTSEMLRTTPLRELSVEVLVHSALPLKKVSCATHDVRAQQTLHSAKVEFTAQEYTPTRDFEVVCEVDSQQSDVVVVPHRRGEDGYFLVQLTPPTAAGNWQREVLPDGAPLDLLLVCDTSASMDARKRKQQAEFVTSVLATLGPRDRFNLAVCDVNCDWLHAASVEPTEAAVAAAVAWLDQRISLGWTDLDRMATSVLKKLGDKTHVVYIGDGVVTAGDADPQGFANRLGRLTGEQRAGTFHAVSIGSSFDSTVLKAVARIGGGSVRHVGGEQTPQQVALELLNEIAQPGLRDLQVEFRGLQVAAVYPNRLPNLPAGTQQILVGRYLPRGNDQAGEIVIRGQRDGQRVSFTSRIKLADAEAGNSFIPRLWARAHLDQLLEEGSNSLIQDQIIALSEEYHIITPYTSLLVLETDEDRERFGVKRRYQMRDGERFFAAGRDEATFALKQQQVKRAGEWRLGLRRRILAELAGLGRDPRMFGNQNRLASPYGALGFQVFDGSTTFTGGYGGALDQGWEMQLGDSRQPASNWYSFDGDDDRDAEPYDSPDFNNAFSAAFEPNGAVNVNLYDLEMDQKELSLDFDFELDDSHPAGGPAAAGESFDMHWEVGGVYKRKANADLVGGRLGGERGRAQLFDRLSSVAGRLDRAYEGDYRQSMGNYVQWLNTLFPTVPAADAQPPRPPESTWPAEAIAISRRLVQPITLDEGGLEVARQTESTDPRWERQTGASDQLELFSPVKWLALTESTASQTVVQWCDQQERGSYSRAFQLGRYRKSSPADLAALVPGRRVFATTPLHESYAIWDADIEHPAEGRVLLILTNSKTAPVMQHRLTIDTTRNVVLAFESHNGDVLTSTTHYDDYVRVAGAWWPGKIASLDSQGRRTSLTTQTVRHLPPAAFERRFSRELPERDAAQMLPMALPTLRNAEIAAASGSADVAHRLVLLLDASRIQDWEVVQRQLAELEKLLADKPGRVWIRAAVLAAARKNEDARQLLLRQADRIAAEQPVDDFFLAEYVLGQIGRIADQNELLRGLERLRAVFERQPAYAGGGLRWEVHYTQALRMLQRTAEVLPRQRELAIAMPWDNSVQTAYARDLANSGDYEAALAWLREQLDRDVERSEYELRELRTMVVTLLREQGRADELVTFCEEWVATDPTYQDTYAQYLHALIVADRTRDADAIARRWLDQARVEGKLDEAPLARLNAAASYARGQRYQIYMNWVDPAWLSDLERTARFFLGHEQHFDVAVNIMDNYLSTDSDESDRLRTEVARRLVAAAADLPPVQVASYVRWSVSRGDLTDEQWKQVAATVRARWEKIADKPQRQTLGGALAQIYGTRFRDSEHLPFLRQRIVRAEAESDAPLAASFANALFGELLSRDWAAEHETEALALIPRLSASEHPSQRWETQIRELHRFVDRMLQARQQADRQHLQDAGRPEELTRVELGKKHVEFQKQARQGVADRLAEAAPEFTDDVFRQWVQAERMFLDLKLGRNRQQVATQCWAILGDAPQAAAIPGDEPDELDAETARQRLWQSLLKERAFTMVSYLAARRSAPKPLVKRVLDFVAAGMKLEGDVQRAWRQQRFALLVALDRPEQLERELREWIREDEVPAVWQLSLGRLLAEQGEINQAVILFETVQRASRLAPADYSALADWYLVADRRAEHDRAKIEVFKFMEEYRISQWLRQQYQPWYQTDVPLPTELNEGVLFAFQALFEKSNQPDNYTYQLREFYTASRDFRLLRMIPDALTGRTPQQAYPFLKSLRASLLSEIRKEATADELLARVAEVRKTTESAIDLRALDLLEAMIERQASEVINQPGPHVDAALAALQRAFQRQWVEGEVRQMADLLADLGTIRHAALNAERLRQLRELLKMTEPGSEDRFFVSYYLAHALFYSHDDRTQGLATMENAVREIGPAHRDGWPVQLNVPLEGYIAMLDAAGQFTAAETLLTKQLEHPLNAQQASWLTQQRNRLYLSALRKDGRVSLGAGADLFVNLEKHLLEQANTHDDNHRQQIVSQILEMYRTAYDKKIAGNEARLHGFAFDLLPEILKRQTNNYNYLVRQTANALNWMLGKRVALEFLIERYETYPERFEYTHEAPWPQFSYQLAEWFKDCQQNIGDYEPRLLAIVLKELRHDLVSRRSRNLYLYHRNSNNYFWEAQAGEFSRVAEQVYQERKDSGRAVTYIARYLFAGLHKYDRAIEIMLDAHQKQRLDTAQQIALCDMLHGQKRYAESIPILEPIVAASPDAIVYRTRLITAYARSARHDQMRSLLAETDRYFRQEGRWIESNIAHLASCCLDIDLFAESAGYYGEVIPLHQRSRADGGIGGSTLSDYYSQQARAYAGMGDTVKAVDAAAAGVVARGSRRGNQGSALHWLQHVLSESKDLDGYVKYLDQQAATTGQDSPLIRQKIGVVYASRGKHQQAIVQLQAAIELQPNDIATHEALIKSYDAIKDREGAVRQTLAMLDFDRHNLDLYKKLAERLKTDEALFERAATTIVEAAPAEAEHHQALAEIRQEQDRWDEAIDCWRHVARLRALEPNGLLKLTEAQLHQKQWDDARKSIQQLIQTEWAPRFSQVRSQVEQLQRKLPKPE